MNLIEFLLARIADDETVARDAFSIESIYRNTTWHWCVVNDGGSRWHPTRHDPARVLAECEAKRRIASDAHAMTHDSTLSGYGWRTLEHLALPYADHPDYRPEWRPYA